MSYNHVCLFKVVIMGITVLWWITQDVVDHTVLWWITQDVVDHTGCGGSHRMLEFALAVVDFIGNCRSHCLLWVTQLVAIVADSGCCGSHRQL